MKIPIHYRGKGKNKFDMLWFLPVFALLIFILVLWWNAAISGTSEEK